MTLIVVSGAPGTGKSTIAAALGAALRGPDRGGHGSARRGREGSHHGPFGSKFVSMPTRAVHPVAGWRLAVDAGWMTDTGASQRLMSQGFPIMEYYRALAELPERFRGLMAESKGGESK